MMCLSINNTTPGSAAIATASHGIGHVCVRRNARIESSTCQSKLQFHRRCSTAETHLRFRNRNRVRAPGSQPLPLGGRLRNGWQPPALSARRRRREQAFDSAERGCCSLSALAAPRSAGAAFLNAPARAGQSMTGHHARTQTARALHAAHPRREKHSSQQGGGGAAVRAQNR